MNLGRATLKHRLAISFKIGTVLSITLVYIVLGLASRGFLDRTKIEKSDEGELFLQIFILSTDMFTKKFFAQLSYLLF